VPLAPLPIDPFIPEVVTRLRESRAAVLTAAPGAGKTTRVPPALTKDGAVILLQPRRVAARTIARRIAGEQGWTLGAEVGWHVRFERRFSPSTRLLVATEGILTARFLQDALLSGFRTIVLDEFHERSIHADLGIALAKQAWLARDDLRILVMSATIDPRPVSDYLGGCPVVTVPGATHPLDVIYRPADEVAAGVRCALLRTSGSILCFLPGAPEIRRALPAVRAAAPAIDVLELHGSMDAAAQDAALAETAGRRVILATNIAETSLTVPGVAAVVDTGLQKVARYDPDRAIDSLETERISRDSADQRAGRAARLGPGLAVRLWSETDRLRLSRQPDIHRMDLSGPMLDILAWGGDPRAIEWFDPPAREATDAALELLRALGALADDRLTPLGRRMQRLPLHPRLARILVDAAGARHAALACALLSERHFLPPRLETTSSDLLSAVGQESDLPPHAARIAIDLAKSFDGPPRTLDETAFRRALLAGYPDRVGKRRAEGSPRVLLASGHGAVVAAESGVRTGDYLIAIDVQAGKRGEGSEARIRLASVVERAWLTRTSIQREHLFDPASGTVRALEREYYGAIVLSERSVPPDPERAAMLLAAAYRERGLSNDDEQLLRRMAFAGLDVEPARLVEQAALACRRLDEIDLARDLPWSTKQEIDRLAPAALTVPSGRTRRLDYEADGTVSMSVKLQELFGLADTPTVGARRAPVLLKLLAPNGRPVQTTRDLRSFWKRTYPEVRKELRGRYPKHPWPEDPSSAVPTARTTRSSTKN
jgi:ATP-dependent helicase HrpB